MDKVLGKEETTRYCTRPFAPLLSVLVPEAPATLRPVAHASNPDRWPPQRLPCFVLNIPAPTSYLESLHSRVSAKAASLGDCYTRLAVPCFGRSVSEDWFGNWRCQPKKRAHFVTEAMAGGIDQGTRADRFRRACDSCLPRSPGLPRSGGLGLLTGSPSSSSRHPFNGCSSLVGDSVDQQGQTRAVSPGCESSRKRGTAESGNWAEGGVQSGDPWRLSVQWVESRKAAWAAGPCHFHFVVGLAQRGPPPADCPDCSTIPSGLFLRLLPRIVQSPSIQLPSSVPLCRGRSFVADHNPPISISHPPTP
jgi:hypothetical protein